MPGGAVFSEGFFCDFFIAEARGVFGVFGVFSGFATVPIVADSESCQVSLSQEERLTLSLWVERVVWPDSAVISGTTGVGPRAVRSLDCCVSCSAIKL